VTFQGSLEFLERLVDGEGEEERGERIALLEAGGGDLVRVFSVRDHD
jgi:hypothetical protein